MNENDIISNFDVASCISSSKALREADCCKVHQTCFKDNKPTETLGRFVIKNNKFALKQ